MPRLTIEAVSNEPKTDTVFVQGMLPYLELFVSVARAEDGSPVSGLKKAQFRLCQPNPIWIKKSPGTASLATVSVVQVTEKPIGQSPPTSESGMYVVRLGLKLKNGKAQVFEENEPYVFGLHVSRRQPGAKALESGQTVVRLQSRNLKLAPNPGKA